MNIKAMRLAIFALGMSIGSCVTFIFTRNTYKTKYEKIAQKEIESVKEVFSYKKSDDDKNTTVKSEAEKSNEADAAANHNYKKIASKYDYTKYSNPNDDAQKSEEKKREDDLLNMNDVPYVISPEDFGEFEDYEEISLVHYADGVLTDDMEEPIEDIEGTVGSDYFEHFGEYEEDSVYIRNDRLKCDYEILRDLSNYSEDDGDDL